jgi:hypothetical protein
MLDAACPNCLTISVRQCRGSFALFISLPSIHTTLHTGSLLDYFYNGTARLLDLYACGRSYANKQRSRLSSTNHHHPSIYAYLNRPSHFHCTGSVARAIREALHADPGETCSLSKFLGLARSAPLVWARENLDCRGTDTTKAELFGERG